MVQVFSDPHVSEVAVFGADLCAVVEIAADRDVANVPRGRVNLGVVVHVSDDGDGPDVSPVCYLNVRASRSPPIATAAMFP